MVCEGGHRRWNRSDRRCRSDGRHWVSWWLRMTLLDEVIVGASGDARIANLLRQVKILASRTGADPLGDWIDHELNGYTEETKLPTYRGPFGIHVYGHFMSLDGREEATDVQIPQYTFDQTEAGADWFRVFLREPVAMVESMATEEQTTIVWSADMVGAYNSWVEAGKVRPVFTGGGARLVGAKSYISRHRFVGALDGVRGRILDLALQLEKVVPEAGQPSAPSAEQAFAAIIINNHFHASSNVAIDSTQIKQWVNSPARGDIEGLVGFLREQGMKPDLLTELRDVANADQTDHEDTGRWTRVRRWFVRVGTEAGTGADGGAVAAAAVGFLSGKMKVLSTQAQDVQQVLAQTERADQAMIGDRPALRAGSRIEAVQRYYDLLGQRLRSRIESHQNTADLEQLNVDELAGILAGQGEVDSTLHDGIDVLSRMYQLIRTDPQLVEDDLHLQAFLSLAQSIAGRLVVSNE
ncbi:hypothetical protein [Kribbella sp. NPDC051620]|uniref:AbiTii domain-containing protein n=1 Tax=Kribbella sp. NPDC051620 TaxID=3364120 RepID=UPI0037964986